MVSEPIVSVVIPIYNGESFIVSTIESVLSQTYFKLQIIIVDNASTDSSLQKLAEIHDPRIKIVQLGKKSGVAASRNEGARHSKGEFIAFLDQDDIWMPNKIELQVQALIANPKAGVAYAWLDMIDEHGKYLSSGYRSHAESDVYSKLVKGNFLLTMSNPLIRKVLFEQIGGFDEACDGCDDWVFLVFASRATNFILVPKTLLHYRKHTRSYSSDIANFEKMFLVAREKVFLSVPSQISCLKERVTANFYYLLAFRAIKQKSRRTWDIVSKAYTNNPEIQRRLLLITFLVFHLLTMCLPVRWVNAISQWLANVYRSEGGSNFWFFFSRKIGFK